MRTKQRRALAIGLCLAFVLLLGQAVEKLFTSPRIRSVSPTAYSIAFSEELNKLPRSSGYIFTSDGNLIDNIFVSTGSEKSLESAGLYIQSRRAASVYQLGELNALKSSLQDNLFKISTQENLSEEKEQEKKRVLDQISLVNAEIDTLLERSKSIIEGSPYTTWDDTAPAEQSPEASSEATSTIEDPINRSADLPIVSSSKTPFSPLMQVAKWLCYFLATIVGIFFKAMWDSSDFKSLLKFSNIKPILIAPIVFYGVYATINTLTDSLLAVLIAFQNGFFWQSILKAEQHKHEIALASQARLVEADVKTVEAVAGYPK